MYFQRFIRWSQKPDQKRNPAPVREKGHPEDQKAKTKEKENNFNLQSFSVLLLTHSSYLKNKEGPFVKNGIKLPITSSEIQVIF